MILQRLAEAIQEQNWFTVIIEVLIVVFGVVIGIEISNLNEDRKFDAQEREFLGQLREEIISNNRRLDGRIAMTEGVIEAGRKGMDFLNKISHAMRTVRAFLSTFFMPRKCGAFLASKECTPRCKGWAYLVRLKLKIRLMITTACFPASQ